jgi:NAD(P)H-hydrate epimerase
LWISPGKQHAGQVTVVPIGIPEEGRPLAEGSQIGLIDGCVLDVLPRREAGSTKFDGGAVLVCGGSPGLTGAPQLASRAAARAGAGYVTALVAASLNLVFEVAQAEVMSVPLPEQDGALTPAALEPALQHCERADALVLGPGLGRAGATADFARELARRAPLPLLLDADGLNAYAGRPEDLSDRTASTVMTPHGGELARLLEVDGDEVRAHRLRLARTAARRSGAVVLLKGDDTIVASPDPVGPVAVSRGGAPALATAGTGDVLSGTIGALLARRIDAFTAACAGVELHRLAGRIVAERVGVEGAIASDVIAALPAARRSRGAA